MATILDATGTGSLPLESSTPDVGSASWLLLAGAGYTNTGTEITADDPSAMSRMVYDVPTVTAAARVVFTGYLMSSFGGEYVLLSIRRQANGERIALYWTINGFASLDYYPASGSTVNLWSGTFSSITAPGWQQIDLSVDAAHNYSIVIKSSTIVTELGSALVTQTVTDAGARIAAAGRTGWEAKGIQQVKRITLTDSSSAPSVSAPLSVTVTEPTSTGFAATVTGTYTSLQWQQSTDGGTTWASVPDGAGANTNSYTTTATGVSTSNHRNGYKYRLAAVWTGGTVFSAAATLTVLASGSAPAITVQPQPQGVIVGATATFTVTATGTGLTYQWRKNGSNISGANSASYTTPATILGDNGALFSVVVSGSVSPAATSSDALLTVSASGFAPSITVQPVSQSAVEGGSATFNVTATGTSLTYQWRKNGTPITGATLASYTTPTLSLADNGALFSVVVTGSVAPAATSTNATLTVTASSGGARFTSATLRRNGDSLVASTTLAWLTLINDLTGAFVATKTNITVDSTGVFSVTDASMVSGTVYRAVWKESTGQRGQGWAAAT